MMAAILICGAGVFTACSNSDNPGVPDTTALDQWQAGKTVDAATVEAFGGIDKCFAQPVQIYCPPTKSLCFTTSQVSSCVELQEAWKLS